MKPSNVGPSQTPVYNVGSGGLLGASGEASAISITDADGHFTGSDVEAALQELGAAPDAGLLASITAASAAIAATETVVVSRSLAANFLVAGMALRIRAAGVGTTGLTPGVDTFRIRIGSTTLTGNIPCSVAPPNNTSVTAQPFSFEALLTVRTAGASGTIIGECLAVGDEAATGLFTLIVDLSAVTATVVVDTTATKLLELTFQSGAASSSATFHVATIEALGAAGGAATYPMAWTRATSMPGSPVTGQRVTRTDLGLDFEWNGTRWLTTTLYRMTLEVGDFLQGQTATGVSRRGTFLNSTALDVWVVAFACWTAVLTTNSAVSYWAIVFNKQDTALAGTSLGSFNTSADAVTTIIPHNTAIGAVVVTASFPGIYVQATKAGSTGTPGALYSSVVMEYRLIGT